MATRHQIIKMTPLLILGGQSTRMGTPKHLLSFPDSRPAYQHALDILQSAVPMAHDVFISVRNQDQLDGISKGLASRGMEQNIAQHSHDHDHDHETISVNYVPVIDAQHHGDIGPAAGLLAAHATAPEATFMVLGSDYPFLPASALLQLVLEYELPVTCFSSVDEESEKEFLEPLIGIWNPAALKMLDEEVGKGRSGLGRVVGLAGGKGIKPLREEWIKGCNTPEEWERALRILKGED